MPEKSDSESLSQSWAKLPPALRGNLVVVVLALAGAALLMANQLAVQPVPRAGTAWYSRWVRWPWSAQASPVDQTTDRVGEFTNRMVDTAQDLGDRVLDRLDRQAGKSSTNAPTTAPSGN